MAPLPLPCHHVSHARVPARSGPCHPLSIAIVGAGPTAVYALDALQRQGVAHRVTLLEAGGQPGQGIPFNARHNGAHLLANIAGYELPAVGETLNAWAMRQSPRARRRWAWRARRTIRAPSFRAWRWAPIMPTSLAA
jgi:cation diffusion facilitator CzcD-associated flavoprotein CzcO